MKPEPFAMREYIVTCTKCRLVLVAIRGTELLQAQGDMIEMARHKTEQQTKKIQKTTAELKKAHEHGVGRSVLSCCGSK